MAAVHRLPAGHELQEEDAEREHVRLLVDDAVRVVLRRQAPDQQETTPSSFHSHGPWPFAFVLFFDSIKSKSGLPEGAFDGRDRPVRPLRRQPLGEPEIRNLQREGEGGRSKFSHFLMILGAESRAKYGVWTRHAPGAGGRR